MPTPLSCRSSSALDSLPRNANARRSGTALHRLQQQRAKQQQHQQSDDFGFWKNNGLQLINSPGPSSSSSPVAPRRSSNRFVARRRKSSKASKYEAVSSGDLPLASSDLYVAETPIVACREALSDGEDDFARSADFDETSSIRIVGHRRGDGPRPRTLSLSPQKLYQPIMKPIESNDSDDEMPAKTASSSEHDPVRSRSPAKRQQQAQPARKRIVTKDMIGKPTNFQHTGHIGAGAYGGVTNGDYDEIKLKQQLSEVAAALRLDDHNVLLSDTRAPLTGSESTLADDEASLNSGRSEQPSAESKSHTSKVPAIEHAEDSAKSAEVFGTPMPPVVVSGLKRTTSKRKPVPAPRALTELYNEFKQEPALSMPDAGTMPTSLPQAIREEAMDETVEVEKEQENIVSKPIPTIRASNGKRLVEGPSGALITETANGRWNKALNEITMALKDENDDDGEDADIEQSLERADTILRRINAL